MDARNVLGKARVSSPKARYCQIQPESHHDLYSLDNKIQSCGVYVEYDTY